MKKIKFLIIFTLLISLLFSLACTEKNPPLSGNDYEDKNLQTTPMLTSAVKYDLFVDSLHSAKFSVPVVVNVDLSSYNTNNATSNSNVYVINCEGEGIQDLNISGTYVLCDTTDEVFVEGAYKYYACIFDFSVSANSNWTSKGIVRKISKIKFKVLSKEVEVPVDINVKESPKCAYVDECPIIDNTNYLTVASRRGDDYILELNWDISGWGAESWTDPNYATIKGFYFENSNLKLTDLKLIEAGYENGEYCETEITVDLNNCDYKLDTLYCAMAGTGLIFSVEIADSIGAGINCVADSLIMQYTINDDAEIHEVSLANIQLYNYEQVLKDFYDQHTAK